AARPYEYEVGDVQAADEQHEQHAAPQQEQDGPDILYDFGLQVDDGRVETSVVQELGELREAVFVPAIDRVDLFLRARDRHAGFTHANHVPVVAVPLAVGP